MHLNLKNCAAYQPIIITVCHMHTINCLNRRNFDSIRVTTIISFKDGISMYLNSP